MIGFTVLIFQFFIRNVMQRYKVKIISVNVMGIIVGAMLAYSSQFFGYDEE